MGENWLQTYSEISLWYTEGLIQPSLVGSLLSFIFGLWNSILSQADLDLYRSRRHENATIEAPHFAFSSNLFHRQIAQIAIHQLGDPPKNVALEKFLEQTTLKFCDFWSSYFVLDLKSWEKFNSNIPVCFAFAIFFSIFLIHPHNISHLSQYQSVVMVWYFNRKKMI